MHDRDEILRQQVMSMRMRENVSGEYVIPEADTNALVALMLAVHKASDRPTKPTIHVWRGVG